MTDERNTIVVLGAGGFIGRHLVEAIAADGTPVVAATRRPATFGSAGIRNVACEFIDASQFAPVLRGARAVRDYLYVDDLVALCRRVIPSALPAGTHVFNASSGSGVRLDTLLDAIDAVTGLPLQRNHQPSRSVDVRSIVPDSSAARTMFRWTPTTRLATGLERTWDWFRTRP